MRTVSAEIKWWVTTRHRLVDDWQLGISLVSVAPFPRSQSRFRSFASLLG